VKVSRKSTVSTSLTNFEAPQNFQFHLSLLLLCCPNIGNLPI
jgi:hypothetical protein